MTGQDILTSLRYDQGSIWKYGHGSGCGIGMTYTFEGGSKSRIVRPTEGRPVIDCNEETIPYVC